MSHSGFSHVSFCAMLGDILEDERALCASGYGSPQYLTRRIQVIIDQHAAARPDKIFLDTLLNLGNAKLLQRLLSHHGIRAYRNCIDRDSIRKIMRHEKDVLLTLIRCKINFSHLLDDVIEQAICFEREDIISIWQNEMGKVGSLFETFGDLNLLNKATPRTAGALALEIDSARRLDPTLEGCAQIAYRSGLPKVLAALALSGLKPNPEHVLKAKVKNPEQKEMHRFLKALTASSHARLALLKTEPCLIDVLGRAPSAGFFRKSSHEELPDDPQ